MDIYSFSVLAFGLCALFTGVQVFFTRNDFVGILFFLYSLVMFGWATGASIMLNNSASYQHALFAIRVGDCFILFIPVLWVHLVSKLTHSFTFTLNILIRLIYVICIAFIPLAFTDFYIPKLEPIMAFQHYKVAGPAYHLFTLLFVTLVPVGFYKLITYFRKIQTRQYERSAIAGFALFSLVGYIGGALCIVPAYGIECPQYALLLMPVYPFGLGYFMIRYKLFAETEMAQAAHKDKLAAMGVLTASMNHEIRSPLFVMRGLIETEEKDSQLSKKLLSQIDRITGVTSRLTHFAKKGVDEEAKIEPLNLNEVIDDVLPLLQHQLQYQNIQFEKNIADDLPLLMADPRYLEEILFNLLINACQAVRNISNPKIKLSANVSRISHNVKRSSNALHASRDASSIVITIEDNGPGITPDQSKHIFKPFHTTKSEGTGLGLYITKQLVEKCGGSIKVESSNQGAKFIVSLKSA